MVIQSDLANPSDRRLEPLAACPPRQVLTRLANAATVPAAPSSRWLDALFAPHAHLNARRDYRQRAEALTAVLEDPGVSLLATWAWGRWNGTVPAVAGVLAAAPVLQFAARSGPVDQPWASRLVESAVDDARKLTVQRQRAGATRRRHTGLIHGIDLDRVAADSDEHRTSHDAAQRAEQVTAWIATLTGAGRRSPKAMLVIEANLPSFWAWYGRRVPTTEIASGRYPAPPLARQLGTGQRLEDHLAGTWDGGAGRVRLATVSRLLLGPRRYRGSPAGYGWRDGAGHWSLGALADIRDRRRPQPPRPEALRWWAHQIGSLDVEAAPWEAPEQLEARVNATG
jgi:hypothetical protein